MCNHCNEQPHSHHPEIVQIMPTQKDLYAVYHTDTDLKHATVRKGNLSLVPVLFMGLIRHGDKTMVEGFLASDSIQSCEDIEGFKGYASSLEHAEKLYT